MALAGYPRGHPWGHPLTLGRMMLRVRSLAVICAREVSRSSCATRGGVARSAAACHTSRAFSDSSRVLAPPTPPPPSTVSEHHDRIHRRAVGAGGATQYSQQQDREVEEVGDTWPRQSRVVSYSRNYHLELRLAI